MRTSTGSELLVGLHNVTGQQRRVDIHGYRVATTGHPQLTIAILDADNKYIDSVVLDPVDVKKLLEQIVEMM